MLFRVAAFLAAVFAWTAAVPALAAGTPIAELGITVEAVTPEIMKLKKLAVSSGLLIESAGSAEAKAAGLSPGDVIVAIAGTPVSDVETAEVVLQGYKPGVKIEVRRIRGRTDEATVGIVLIASAPPGTRGPSTTRGPTISQADPPGGSGAGQKYRVIKVYYATDREKTKSQNPSEMYSGERGTLQLGICEVTIPASHSVGMVESPSLLRIEWGEDPEKHVILKSVTQQKEADFYADIGARIAQSGNKDAFLFVHGYNVTFKDAARRTAQMAHDLKFTGAPVFFSWPSQGTYFGYKKDESNIEYGKSDLKAFIKQFAAKSEAKNIYLVAHSMGNRALTNAIGEVFRDNPDVRAKIKEIILAAPDIDADIFKRDIAPNMVGAEQSITLYASSNDWALKASKTFNGYQRAGDTGGKPTIVNGIVTIDSSAAETDFLGHSYFAESTSIIGDIFSILAGKRNPEERVHLIPIDDAAGRYWRLPAGAR